MAITTKNLESIMAAMLPYKGDPEVEKVINFIVDEINQNASKSNGNGNLYKLASAYLRKNSGNSGMREALKYAEIKGEYLYMTNAYSAFRFTDTTLPLPMLPEGVIPFDFKSLFECFSTEGVRYELPSVKALKSYISIWNVHAKTTYGKNAKNHPALFVLRNETNEPTFVDARYLLEVLQMLSNPTASASVSKKGAVMFHADNGDALLCCVFVQNGSRGEKIETFNRIIEQVNA